ncbi:uridine phosphorylase [uncultured Ruminococcus sp.]|uniref:uridine phosphorylase n=1 Tax=uncultured Ruminococcus sp. TaxID=165186 RepID=UPI002584BE1E|nr:uridine phosphorylase [uncultured Ruminococcus sp.]
MAERQFHIQCTAEDIGHYVFLPGDPDRVPWIASYLENAQKVAQSREFTTYTGTLDGTRVSVTSTGIGGPSAAIAMEELAALGAHTFLRIGTCGGMQPELVPGALIIPTGAIRMEGTSQEYMPLAFPAVPDFGLTEHLVYAARAAAYDYHTGVVQCKDSFYGQHSPETMPVAPTLLQNWQAWKAAGTLASEMESAALFTVAAARHVRCATILQMLWNQERQTVIRDKEHAASDMTHAIEVAVAAMRAVIRENKETAV